MIPEYPQSRSKLSAGRQTSTIRVARTIQKWSSTRGRPRPTASRTSSRTRINGRLDLALLGVDEPLALRDHLVVSVLGDRDVHVHRGRQERKLRGGLAEQGARRPQGVLGRGDR